MCFFNINERKDRNICLLTSGSTCLGHIPKITLPKQARFPKRLNANCAIKNHYLIYFFSQDTLQKHGGRSRRIHLLSLHPIMATITIIAQVFQFLGSLAIKIFNFKYIGLLCRPIYFYSIFVQYRHYYSLDISEL